jgi:hypothetical protein
MDYMIQETGKGEYCVTKWNGSEYPVSIYKVGGAGPYWNCNCPCKGGCKHISMVKKWKRDGMPSFIDDSYTKEFIKEIMSQ